MPCEEKGLGTFLRNVTKLCFFIDSINNREKGKEIKK
jgi:hypothetical protein